MVIALCASFIHKLLNRHPLVYRSFGRVMAETSTVAAASEEQQLADDDETGQPPTKKPLVSTEPPCEDKASRKRKKFALLMAYCGAGYIGMQRNPGVLTIEEVLLEALLKAKLIDANAFASPNGKANFQRAARTDKGVSAAGQLVSLYMFDQGSKLVPDLINQYLPDKKVQILGIFKTTKGFDSKIWCTGRTYSYVLPTYSFREHCTADGTALNEQLSSYRIDQPTLDRLSTYLQHYKGTHNFHNFTSGLAAEDRSAIRYMISLQVGKPFIDNGMEFLAINIKGQSFMLHQIRKMIGLAIAIVRGNCGNDTLGKAWGPERVDIPMAPPLGLFLDRLHYDGYNQRYGKDGVHTALDWVGFEQAIEDFKAESIIKHIVNEESTNFVMLNWLSTLNLHSFDYVVNLRPDVTSGGRPVPETGEGLAFVQVALNSAEQKE